MKALKIIAKILAVLAVAAGVAYSVYHFQLDKKLIAWVKKCRSNCPLCRCACAEEEPVEEIPEGAAEAPAEETVAVEPASGIVPECTMDDVEPAVV